jgi:transcriptional regulator with XRE-family HTH domain
MQNPSDTARSLANARKSQGHSLRDLASLSGVSAATISRMERGYPVYLETVQAIAAALGKHFALTLPPDEPQHFVVLVNGHDSKTWYASGVAAQEGDGRIRLTLPLLARRTLLLRPVADASEAEAWPFRVTEREAWPKAEG